VYIREAHPSDGWQVSANLEEGVLLSTPASYGEKTSVAHTCVKKLGLELPALIDDFANTTEIAYSAWPDRLYLIDAEGRIAYKAKPGPFGFDPEELRAALARLLGPGSP
jgi:type I thyroxine 5'-deiodinase